LKKIIINKYKHIGIINKKNKFLLNKYFINYIKKINKHRIVYISGGNSLNFFLKNTKKIYSKAYPEFYLTDERLCKKKEKTNFYNIKKRTQSLNFLSFNYLEMIDNKKLENFCCRYLPNPHLIIFCIGEDGHIASIFEKKMSKKKFFITQKKKENFKRISITFSMILKSKEIIFYINKHTKNKFLKKLVNGDVLGKYVPFFDICKKYKKKITIFTYKLN